MFIQENGETNLWGETVFYHRVRAFEILLVFAKVTKSVTEQCQLVPVQVDVPP